MCEIEILIIDDDAEMAASLQSTFAQAGVAAESVNDAFAAMEKLRQHNYCAVILDPMIRHRLNGYAVLNFIELEKPDMIGRLFLLTGMSEQTIRRTAPSMLPRLFRKPSAVPKIAEAVLRSRGSGTSGARNYKGSVLLIEDDAQTAALTQSLIEELGYSVEWAQNGADALEALASRDFDGILLDLVMPQVDGFTLLEHFHEQKPGLLRRVIITTGLPEKYVAALDQTTFGGIIRKPIEVKMLEEMLAGCVGPAS